MTHELQPPGIVADPLLEKAIGELVAWNHWIEVAADAPGQPRLFQVDGGPAMTEAQVIAMARAEGLI